MPFIAIYDTGVMAHSVVRDLHIRIAQAGLVQAKWTDRILDEALAARRREEPGVPPEKVSRERELIIESVPDCLVSGYEPLTAGITLPDLGNLHVLAAAIKAGAQAIVTSHPEAFPPDGPVLADIEVKTPDEFVLDQIDFSAKLVWACVQQVADSRKWPPATIEDMLAMLERYGLVTAVAALRAS